MQRYMHINTLLSCVNDSLVPESFRRRTENRNNIYIKLELFISLESHILSCSGWHISGTSVPNTRDN